MEVRYSMGFLIERIHLVSFYADAYNVEIQINIKAGNFFTVVNNFDFLYALN